MRVLVSDVLGDIGVKMFQAAEGIEVDVNTGLSPEALKEIIGDYHALVIRSATRVTADLLEVATNLKVVGSAGGKCRYHGRACHRHDAFTVTKYSHGYDNHERRFVGEEAASGKGNIQQGTGDHWFWKDRIYCCGPWPWAENESGGLRSAYRTGAD